MNDPMPEAPAPADVPGKLREKLRLIQRASRGDKKALPAVRFLLGEEPETFLRACKAELAEVAEHIIAGALAKDSNLAFREGIGRKLELLRAELAGPDPRPVERLLAERAALCWLDAHCCDIRHAALTEAKGVLSLRLQDAYDRMRDRAHRRYLQALKALAQVRKLGPAIQVNLARNQVNVAGAGPVALPDGPTGSATGPLSSRSSGRPVEGRPGDSDGSRCPKVGRSGK